MSARDDAAVAERAREPMAFFSHDSHAASDIKCRRLIRRFGMEGYGRWWLLCELLAAARHGSRRLSRACLEPSFQHVDNSEEAQLDACGKLGNRRFSIRKPPLNLKTKQNKTKQYSARLGPQGQAKPRAVGQSTSEESPSFLLLLSRRGASFQQAGHGFSTVRRRRAP